MKQFNSGSIFDHLYFALADTLPCVVKQINLRTVFSLRYLQFCWHDKKNTTNSYKI